MKIPLITREIRYFPTGFYLENFNFKMPAGLAMGTFGIFVEVLSDTTTS